MTSDQALLTQIAEELPYLNTKRYRYMHGVEGVIQVLRFGVGEMHIAEGILCIQLLRRYATIDLFTCKDLVKEINECLHKCVKIEDIC